MPISRAIQKYGKDNFKFEILLSNLTREQANIKEQEYIIKYNSKTPNGYNVSNGGGGAAGISHYGANNPNAHLSESEAQYILDNRNIPAFILY